MIKANLERLAHLERLGWLAAGLAHDLNNALVGVLGDMTEIRERLGEMRMFLGALLGGGAAIPAGAIGACESSLDRMGHALQAVVSHGRDLQQLYRGDSPTPGSWQVDLRDAASRAIGMVGGRLRPLIELAGSSVQVAVDRETIVRVLLNLLINASDAVAEGKGTPRIRLHISRAPSWAVCDVIDSGGGIPAEIMPKLFEPFATTKPGGTGLGLAVSRQLVREAGGDLLLVHTGPDGTTFRLILPLAATPD
jgi:signal transduction histidine kinase